MNFDLKIRFLKRRIHCVYKRRLFTWRCGWGISSMSVIVRFDWKIEWVIQVRRCDCKRTWFDSSLLFRRSVKLKLKEPWIGYNWYLLPSQSVWNLWSLGYDGGLYEKVRKSIWVFRIKKGRRGYQKLWNGNLHLFQIKIKWG